MRKYFNRIISTMLVLIMLVLILINTINKSWNFSENSIKVNEMKSEEIQNAVQLAENEIGNNLTTYLEQYFEENNIVNVLSESDAEELSLIISQSVCDSTGSVSETEKAEITKEIQENIYSNLCIKADAENKVNDEVKQYINESVVPNITASIEKTKENTSYIEELNNRQYNTSDNLTKTQDELSESTRELKEECSSLDDKIATSQTSIDELTQDLSTVTDQLLNVDKENASDIDDIYKQVLSLQVALTEESDNLETLRNEKDELDLKIDSNTDDILASNEKIDLVSDNLDDTKNVLNNTNNDLENTKGDLLSTCSLLELTNTSLESTKGDLRSTSEYLALTSNTLEETKTELGTTKENLKSASQSIQMNVTSIMSNSDAINMNATAIRDVQTDMDIQAEELSENESKIETNSISISQLTDEKASISDLNQYLLDLCYPVGSLYMSTKDVSPQSFLGGSWERIVDKTLVGAGNIYAANSTGGSSTTVLNPSNIPTLSSSGSTSSANVNTSSNGAGDYSLLNGATSDYTGWTSVNGEHTHTMDTGVHGVPIDFHDGSHYGDIFHYDNSMNTGSAGSHNHTYYVPSLAVNGYVSIGNHYHSFTVPSLSVNAKYVNNAVQAINVQNPYTAVYMWKRIS